MGRRQLQVRLILCLLLAPVSACDNPAAPSKIVFVRSIRYQRVYPPATTDSAMMWIEMSIPIAGEQSGRSKIPICFPTQAADGSFVCDGLNWDVPVNDDCWVNVRDPLLGRTVATDVFVNGQRITRIRTAGTDEIGDFRVDTNGTIH